MLLLSSTKHFRLGGLSALLGGVLFVVVYLINVGVNLFFSGPDELGATASTNFRIQSALGLPGQVLLALGLVGVYARHSEATGTIGFIGFLWAFVGMFFASGIIWAALLADLGWVLVGCPACELGCTHPRPLYYSSSARWSLAPPVFL